MTFFKDIMIAILFAIILNIFVHQLAFVLNSNLQYNEKFQRSLIVILIFGILSLVLGNTIFKSNKKYKNKVLRYGLNIGGVFMIIFSTVANWDKMDDVTKLIVFALLLFGIIWYVYRWYEYDKNKKQKFDKSEKIEKKRINNKIIFNN